MKFIPIFLLGLIPFFISSCSLIPSSGVRPDDLTFAPLTFEVPEVEPVRLANGIRVYLLEDPELPLVEVTAMIGAGSIADPPEIEGRCSLFASLLENGGAGELDPKAFEEYLESLAIDFSVSSGSYATTINLSVLKEDYGRALNILDDVLRRPRFDSDRLELLRRQSIEGIRRQNDNPGSIAGRTLNKAVYGEHPLGRTPTVETVSAISREDLLNFHRQHFVPDNLWLAISGDFDRERLLADLNRLFEDWPAADYHPQPLPDLPLEQDAGVWFADKDIPQATIRLGHLGIDKDNPDLQAVRVMNFILGGGGFNSRLMREIRSNRGLAYSVYSYFQVGRRLPGSFIAGSETKCASTWEVTSLMLDEFGRIRDEEVSGEELTLAKESLINSFVFAFANSHQVLNQQVRLDFFDYPDDYLRNYRERVSALTPGDIQRAAQTYLHPDKLSVVVVGCADEVEKNFYSLGLPVFEVPLTDGAKEAGK